MLTEFILLPPFTLSLDVDTSSPHDQVVGLVGASLLPSTVALLVHAIGRNSSAVQMQASWSGLSAVNQSRTRYSMVS